MHGECLVHLQLVQGHKRQQDNAHERRSGCLNDLPSDGRANPNLYNVKYPPVGAAALKTKLFLTAFWWSWTGSNRRPEACKATALPTELQPLENACRRLLTSKAMVGLGRLELPTLRLSGVRSNHLSYRPG